MRDPATLWREHGVIGLLDRGWARGCEGIAGWRLGHLLGRVRNLWRLPALRRRHRGGALHLGCGPDRRAGFLNADLGLVGDAHVDARRRFPFPDGMFSLICSESMLEHLEDGEAPTCLRECRRVLEPGGTLRLAVPDLAYYVRCYRDPEGAHGSDWPPPVPERDQASTKLTAAQALQLLFYEYRHRHLYDREELGRALQNAGFADLTFFPAGVGSCDATTGLERRGESLLVVEAVTGPDGE